MNFAELRRKLIAAERSRAPGDSVPYAFEKSVMARLRDARMEDSWTLWGRSLWRGAFACVAVSLALSVWSLQANGHETSEDLESTMVAAAEQLVDSW